MPIMKLREYLDAQNLKYVVHIHSPAYTAQEIAMAAHIPGKELAKTVIVKIDGRTAMVVMPANERINFAFLKEATGAHEVSIAREEEFEKLFPDCEVGAMPPFGNLYDIEVFVSERLAEHEEITFNACSHRELIRMPYADFQRLVKPTVLKSLSATVV